MEQTLTHDTVEDEKHDAEVPDGYVWAVDERTGMRVLGEAEPADRGQVVVDPLGPAYQPGRFTADRGDTEEVDEDDESAELARWDIISLCLMGALDQLDEGSLGLVETTINTGHL